MSMSMRRQFAVVAALAVLGGGLALAPGAGAAQTSAPKADGVSAASCLGNAKGYFKDANNSPFHPMSGWYKTTSACNDIQIKPNTNRYVAVCLYKGGCRGRKLAKAGEWTVLASNVATGTQYHFSFRSTARSTGKYAA
ncbi:hypothetical protein MTQ01_20450 [Streptomyces sp. XM4193]|uniref:hypothetical protein n=1 Tax=Streptomyces sp. XM4193 TaxID=2929782 RepID=UPI001FF7275E|nr:hypothetical protein [Streptomyces sp. XM4193]MCK1798352.1 hypothetical protein [Streptomyces sp. XM4193]